LRIRGETGGRRNTHVEEMGRGWGRLGGLHDLRGGDWLAGSVRKGVNEIARLLEAGERGTPACPKNAIPPPLVRALNVGSHRPLDATTVDIHCYSSQTD